MTIAQMNQMKEERGYSYDMIASYSGLPRATVVNVLTGISARPRKATMSALEKVFAGQELDYPGKRVHYGLSSRDPEYQFRESANGSLSVSGSKESARSSSASVLREPSAGYQVNTHDAGITAEEFMHMELDFSAELINGRIVRRAEPEYVHSEICEYFYDVFRDYIRAHGGKCKPKVSDTNVILPPEDGRESVVCPDFFVICREELIDWYGINGAPDFVLEVVSKENRKNDYVIKSAKYSASGVREYWIIDPIKKALVINVYEASDESFSPTMRTLSGSAGVHIFGEELKIDLDKIAEMVERYGEKKFSTPPPALPPAGSVPE